MPLFFPFENEKMKMITLLGGREGPVGQIGCQVSANQLSQILLQVTLQGRLLCCSLPGRERVHVQTCFEGEGFRAGRGGVCRFGRDAPPTLHVAQESL